MRASSPEYKALNKINAGDHGIVMYVDTSTPLIIQFQLFWFDERITEFLERAPRDMFVCSNGVRIGLANEFKYTPAEMETEEGYLTGFSSNTQQDCYDKLTIQVGSDDEKVGVVQEVTHAIAELVRAASNFQPGVSPVMSWTL